MELGRRGPSWRTSSAPRWRPWRGRQIGSADASRPTASHGSSSEATSPARVEKVAAEIRRADPAGECVVLLVAAPPCQDFSQIGAEAGHRGARGGLFLRSAEFVLELRAALRGWRVGFLFENVVMEPASAKEVSDCLGVPPVLVCASGFWVDLAAAAVVALGGPPAMHHGPGQRRPAGVDQEGPFSPPSSGGASGGGGRVAAQGLGLPPAALLHDAG